MIFTWSLQVDFEFGGKQHKVLVDKMMIQHARPEHFFRVASKKGNIDIIRHNGQWLVIDKAQLPSNVLDALGAGIEAAMKRQGLEK